ncbi:hypothetical protein AB0D62_30290 [Streptomyces massasporeus]|uniref:hypothetical protein n=1 Tax=Streptomyces massasporeus TaxID=67324 RepID=UPI0033DAF359
MPEHLQQERLVRAVAEHAVDEIQVLELEPESPHRLDQQFCSRLGSQRADHLRGLSEVAERPVARELGEALHGVKSCEDDLRRVLGVGPEALELLGLVERRGVGLEELVALIEQDQQSATGFPVQPGPDADAHPLGGLLSFSTPLRPVVEYLCDGQLPQQDAPQRLEQPTKTAGQITFAASSRIATHST